VLGKVGEIFRKGYVLDGVKHRLRKTDVACRWGGEEFVCLLEETDAEGAFVFAERIRRAVSELVIEDLNGASFGIKMSAGIMEMRTKRFLELGLGGNAGVEYVFDHADQALYRAKASGRNQTVVWTEEGSAPESADVLGKADETGVKRNPLPGRKDDALSEEVRAMLEQGEPPERYSERKDKKEGARAFLARVYGRYLEKGDERIYLHEIRRLDPRFANSLQLACLRAGEPVWLSVPKRSDLTDRTLAAVGEEKATEITKAARALERRKPRASARSRKA
jgi:hypothetical protein